MNLKTTLITLSCIAGLLIVITFYVVFYGSGGTYVVSSSLGPNTGIFATSTGVQAGGAASSTTSSTLALASSSGDSATSPSLSSAGSGTAPVTWTQGNETLSVINAAIFRLTAHARRAGDDGFRRRMRATHPANDRG